MNAPGGKVYYKYDDHGNRIYKKQGSLEEYYLLDQSGRELAVYNAYTGTDSLKTVNLYGSGMIGRVNVNWIVTEYEDPETNDIEYYTTRRDNAVYYIKDHLGSIRVAVNNTGFPVFAENTYPFGEISRSYQGSGYGTQKYDFIPWGLSAGKERDAESGLNYFGARYYDSELGRWLSVDPRQDDALGESPYNYCHNSPLNHIDPDGRFANWLGGAIIGAGMDYLCQVAVNKLEGKTWGESLTKVDLKSIGVSAVTGAVGAGLADKIGKLSSTLGKMAANAVIDGVSNAAGQYVTTGKVDLKQTAVAIGTGAVIGKYTSGKSAKSTESKIAEKELDRAGRIASHSTRQGRKTNVTKAEERLEFVKDVVPQYKTSVATTVINKTYEVVSKDKKNKK